MSKKDIIKEVINLLTLKTNFKIKTEDINGVLIQTC